MTVQIPSVSLPAFDLLGQEVEISQIDQSLQELFEAGSDEKGHGGMARASLINLALYNENNDELEKDEKVLAELTSKTACRSFLIHVAPQIDTVSARAWVQAHCEIDRNGGNVVCTEQISFFLTGRSPGLLRNLVLAHLDSDLPLAFWWRGEISDAFEEGLYSRIDRLLYDSESWEAPRDQFLRLIEFQRTDSAPYVMHDLAYTRINGIRNAIANAFDRPLVTRELGALSQIDIRYAEGFRLSALYLASWIATRLDMRIDATHSTASSVVCQARKKNGAGEIVFNFSELEENRRGTVEIDFDLGEVRVEVSRCQTRDFIRTHILRSDKHAEGAVKEEDWLPAQKMDDAALVSNILNRAGQNRTHSQILPGVLELLAL